MPARRRSDISGLRELVRQRVDASSLRAIADEIGISKSGLDSFLKGREPYSRTRAKLNEWSARQRHAESRSVPRQDFDAAMAVVDLYVKAAGSEAVRERRVREVVARITQSS
ncbi:MAG: hypothetical protein JWM41_2047 [Gemmatimonadetes bacterium]|nr:hypothetical protein [Gemmatimonadota bacterium]